MIKRKNYMLKFSLNITSIIFPVFLLAGIIVTIITAIYEPLTSELILMTIMIIILGTLLGFVVSMIMGYIIYVIDNLDYIHEEEYNITNGKTFIKRENIVNVRAKKFMFLYEFQLYSKPLKKIATWTYYFNNKEDLIEFLETNYFFIKYVCDADLANLGLNKEAYSSLEGE